METQDKSNAPLSALIVGAGAWGTAIANVFARGGCTAYLWDNNSDLILEMQKRGCHPTFCPEIALEETVLPLLDLNELEVFCTVFVAPFQNLRAAAEIIKSSSIRSKFIVSASKGIENDTLLLSHEVIADVFTSEVPFAQLSGPSFASEVMRGLPTAVTVGTSSEELATFLNRLLHHRLFRVYLTDDIVGVEVGGALKNVIAIATGISDGLNQGSNARAALIVRGLGEISRYGQSLGAKRYTFMGLSGLGDLLLTCSDDQSRNRRFGFALARTGNLEDAVNEVGGLVEGFHTAKALSGTESINLEEFPVISEIIAILQGYRTPRDSLERLLSREATREVS